MKNDMKSICDITNDECLEVAKILGGADHITEQSRIYQVKELLKGIYTKQTNIPGIKWINVGMFLSQAGYDLRIMPTPPLPPEDRVRYSTKQTTPKPPNYAKH